MATHSGGRQDYGRKFQISRENGQADKNGTPYFFEWLGEQPTPAKDRKFETRGQNHYELFKALDGRLTGFERKNKTIQEVVRDFLYVELQDGDEKYTVEIGDYDGRFALDLMKRMLNQDFDPSAKMRISPYAILDNDTQKWNIGIAVFSGVNKISAKRDDVPILAECPQAETREWKGKTEWDFAPVGTWLYAKVLEKLGTLSVPEKAPTVSDTTPINPNITANTAPPFDDLPF